MRNEKTFGAQIFFFQSSQSWYAYEYSAPKGLIYTLTPRYKNWIWNGVLHNAVHKIIRMLGIAVKLICVLCKMSITAYDIHENTHFVLCKVNFIMDQNKNCPTAFNKAHHNAYSPVSKEQILFQTFRCNSRSQLDKHDFHISTFWRWLNADNFINKTKEWFEILKMPIMCTVGFWNVTPSTVVKVDWYFTGSCCLYHQRRGKWWWTEQDPLMYQYIANRPLGVTSHNTAFFITDRKRIHTLFIYTRDFICKKIKDSGSLKI
jgi:hypothetical protein